MPAQRCDFVVKTAAQLLLDPRRGAVGDHRAVVINNPTQDHRNGDPGDRDRDGDETGAVEHA